MRHCALEVKIRKKRDSSLFLRGYRDGAGGISLNHDLHRHVANLKDAPPRMSYTHPWRLPRFGDIACSRRPSSGFPPAAGAHSSSKSTENRSPRRLAISARSLVIQPLAYYVNSAHYCTHHCDKARGAQVEHGSQKEAASNHANILPSHHIEHCFFSLQIQKLFERCLP